jgi:hypothetical protein
MNGDRFRAAGARRLLSLRARGKAFLFSLAKMICICVYLVKLLQKDETRTERSGRCSLAPE